MLFVVVGARNASERVMCMASRGSGIEVVNTVSNAHIGAKTYCCREVARDAVSAVNTSMISIEC